MNASNQGIIYAYEKGYRVTDDGSVYNPKGKRLVVNSNGNKRYPMFGFKHNGEQFYVRMHRFAAYCFYGSSVFKKGIVVRHLNDDKTDLSMENIKLGTQKENMADLSEDKLQVIAEKKRQYALENGVIPPRNLKISDSDALRISALIDAGFSYREIARIYNVHHSSIYYINKARRNAL